MILLYIRHARGNLLMQFDGFWVGEGLHCGIIWLSDKSTCVFRIEIVLFFYSRKVRS